MRCLTPKSALPARRPPLNGHELTALPPWEMPMKRPRRHQRRCDPEKKLNEFAISVHSIVGACGAAGSVVPPFLSPDVAKQHARILGSARRELGKLILQVKHYTSST
jgi:hypothetical protein